MAPRRYNGNANPDLQAVADELRQIHAATGNGSSGPSEFPWDHPLEPFTPLDYTQLPDHPSFTRQWLVDNWFPLYETTGLGGPGGEGKTLLAHMLATAATLGGSWLGLPVRPMKAAIILCEDRDHDAHLRQADINRHYRCTMAGLAGQLLVLPRRDRDHNYLAIFDRDGNLHLTAFFHQLLAELQRFGAQLVILDTRSDVFWGNQNDERHSRLFVRKVCDRIAWTLGGLVLLLFQPSLFGLKGSGTSGSVQWDAAFRARAYLQSADDDTPELRHLTCLKSNYAAKGETLEITWQNGVFVRTTPDTGYEAGAHLAKWCRVFLDLLDQWTAANRLVSSNPGARNPPFAPKAFATDPRRESCTQSQLDRAMATLFARQQITNLAIGKPSDGKNRIARQ